MNTSMAVKVLSEVMEALIAWSYLDDIFEHKKRFVYRISLYFLAYGINLAVFIFAEDGTRLYSSTCGSLVNGVLFIATICSNGDIYIYKDGKEIDYNRYLEEI